MLWQTTHFTKISAAFIANSCLVSYLYSVKYVLEYINVSKIEEIIYTQDTNIKRNIGVLTLLEFKSFS